MLMRPIAEAAKQNARPAAKRRFPRIGIMITSFSQMAASWTETSLPHRSPETPDLRV
jgi:hypothetical protein